MTDQKRPCYFCNKDVCICEKCEGCGKYRPLSPIGKEDDDVMLCDPCWDSAYKHKKHKGAIDCGNEHCEICYEEE